MSEFRNLIAWQKSMDLVDAVYDAAADFPEFELYGLGQQIRRAAVGVPSSIAEGRGRRTRRDYARFLYDARGSVHEIETQVEIAVRRGYLSREDANRLITRTQEVGKLISAIIPKDDRPPST